MSKKKMNQEATIKAILDKCSRSIGYHIDMEKFNQKIKEPDAEQFIRDAAEFCEVEVIYL